MLHIIIGRILSDPDRVYQEMMENNEEFRKFVEENKNKSTEQLIAESNINIH